MTFVQKIGVGVGALALVVMVGVGVGRVCALSGRAAGTSAVDTEGTRAPRIVSFAPAATECLFFVGLGSNVVGRSSFCDFPVGVEALPVVGDLQLFDEKMLAQLVPTHAVVSSRAQGVVAYLEALGVECIEARTETDADVVAFLDGLGARFGAYTNGVMLEWKDGLQKWDGSVRDMRAALILDSEHGPRQECMVAGTGSYYDSLLQQVGYENAFRAHVGFTALAPEELLRAKVDVLFVVGFSRESATIEREWGAWMGEAVRIVALTGSWAYRPGPRMVELKKALAEAEAEAEGARK